MTPTDPASSPPPPAEESSGAQDPFHGEADAGFLAEFWEFLRASKKWWMLPILLVLLLLGVLLVLAQTAAAPFIYTLF